MSMSLQTPIRTRAEARREDWLPGSVLSGFAATIAMTICFAIAYGLAKAIGDAEGGSIVRWFAALVDNSITQNTSDIVVLAIALNLLMGLALALVYGRFVEPALSGPGWRKGMLFALVPWVLSVVAFLPLMGGGPFGRDIGAGPLPILGNLILHLVYGGVLGGVYGIALEAGLDDNEIDRANAVRAERGAAIGVPIGIVVGLLVGWAISSTVDGVGSQAAIVLGISIVGAGFGLLAGSMAGMGSGRTAANR